MNTYQEYFGNSKIINLEDIYNFLNCSKNEDLILWKNNEDFRAHIKKGEILDYLNNIVSQFVERFNSFLPTKTLNPIYVCVYEDDKGDGLNGFTTKKGNSYFIGIKSSIFSLLPIMIEQVADNINIENIGIEFLKHSPQNDNNAILEQLIDENFVLRNLCEDKISTIIFNNILHMILDHEVGHILAGHPDSSQLNFEFNEDFNGGATHGAEIDKSQFKEYQADYLGVRNHLALSLTQQSHISKLTLSLFLDIVSMSILISAFILNKGTDTPARVLDELRKQNTHPPYSVRFKYIIIFMKYELSMLFLKCNTIKDEDEYRKLLEIVDRIFDDSMILFLQFLDSLSKNCSPCSIVMTELYSYSEQDETITYLLQFQEDYKDKANENYKGYIDLYIPCPDFELSEE